MCMNVFSWENLDVLRSSDNRKKQSFVVRLPAKLPLVEGKWDFAAKRCITPGTGLSEKGGQRSFYP